MESKHPKRTIVTQKLQALRQVSDQFLVDDAGGGHALKGPGRDERAVERAAVALAQEVRPRARLRRHDVRQPRNLVPLVVRTGRGAVCQHGAVTNEPAVERTVGAARGSA